MNPTDNLPDVPPTKVLALDVSREALAAGVPVATVAMSAAALTIVDAPDRATRESRIGRLVFTLLGRPDLSRRQLSEHDVEVTSPHGQRFIVRTFDPQGQHLAIFSGWEFVLARGHVDLEVSRLDPEAREPLQ